MFDMRLKPLRDAGPRERALRLAAAVVGVAAVGVLFWVGGASVTWAVVGAAAIAAVALVSDWRRRGP